MRVSEIGRRAAVAAAVVLTAMPSFARDGGDIMLSGLAQQIESAGKVWAPALMVLGALVTGGAIFLGAAQAGEKVRNFLLGGVFLAGAAAGGAYLVGKFSGF